MADDGDDNPQQSLKPGSAAQRALRQRLDIWDELTLALTPTITILIVFAFVQALSRQRLLFASLASSAFLIYLDPEHGTNRVRTLILAQMLAALLGLGCFLLFGGGYLSGGVAMVATIVLMIVLDVVHPPAVSTALAFAFRAGNENNLLLFALAVAITAVLVLLQRFTLWTLERSALRRRRS